MPMQGTAEAAARPASPPAGTEAHPLALVAALGSGAGLAAAVTRLATDFDHGVWLVAYLALVGCLAPALLCAGERMLLSRPSGHGAASAAALWLAGVIAVPAGVLGGTRVLVCAGAVCLIAALLLLIDRAFNGGATAAPERSPAGLAAHALTIAVMAVSTGIGVLLAWSYPWL